jgi:aconitate hydratase A / 2-methylisocitrate dehydratase
MNDHFEALKTLQTDSGPRKYCALATLEEQGFGSMSRLPYSIRILLEAALRNYDGFATTEKHIRRLAGWKSTEPKRSETPFMPARILLQDFTGVPALVDLAAMRSALARMGGDPKLIQPKIPVDLVIDHSVQVDNFGVMEALKRNTHREFERNHERYEFLKWGQGSIDGLRVAPPSTGIVHQVNLEYLGKVVFEEDNADKSNAEEQLVYPDTLVGTDSHTPMINGLGILGWGVGGIEAESTMLGQPMSMLIPDVIGFKLNGKLPEGATATDMVLTITEKLRGVGVVGKFVEFFGPGVTSMSLTDRATISNMSPEQGATVGYFPVDAETLRYLTLSGRPATLIDLVERYYKQQGLFRTEESPVPEYTSIVELDLSSVKPSLAGPRRPQDRIELPNMKTAFDKGLTASIKEGGFAVPVENISKESPIHWDNDKSADASAQALKHGSTVIAAITSCTNTSNPSVMLAAGLLAKKAVERGLTVPAYVKTSLAPGSQVVTEYLKDAGLLPYLEKLGFYVVAYGCTTCIGNSGPLPEPIVSAINENKMVVASVLSGNRNFEGRVSPHTSANFLCSPPLVVAFALAGKVDIDLKSEPLGAGSDGAPVYLKDIWPTSAETLETVTTHVTREMFVSRYADVWNGNAEWNKIPGSGSELYQWNSASTYIQEPPFFEGLTEATPSITEFTNLRALAIFGDTITTDHISPAGAIPADGPAGQYLQSLGVTPREFNSFGSRRGNDRVMTRGTFANIRIKNHMVPGVEGGYTLHQPSGEQMTIFDASVKYRQDNTRLFVIAGKEYGTGSSRDWAAKGTFLLGVKAVLAESFERIHRSNLVGMGVLPLNFRANESADFHKLDGSEKFDILGLNDNLQPQQKLKVVAHKADGSTIEFEVIARIDTPLEVEYYRHGGILHAALRGMASQAKQETTAL